MIIASAVIFLSIKLLSSENILDKNPNKVAKSLEVNENFDPFHLGLPTLKHGGALKVFKNINGTSKHKFSKIRNFLQNGSANEYCASFHACDRCVTSSRYHCDWCHDYGCTSKSETLCPLAKRSTYPRLSNEKITCTIIYPYDSSPVIAHIGKVKITFRTSVYDPVMLKKKIYCMVRMINYKKPFLVLAEVVDNVVYCEPFEFSDMQHTSGTVQLFWGGYSRLSNELPVLLYDCDKAKYCGSCQKIPNRFQCGWCHKIHRCLHREHCGNYYKWIGSDKLQCKAVAKGVSSYFPLL